MWGQYRPDLCHKIAEIGLQWLEVCERLAEEGAEKILRGWFDRSLDAAITGGYWRRHPTFEQYVAMTDVGGSIPAEVWELLRARYGRIEGEIAPGYSYWLPEGEERAEQWEEHRKNVARGDAKPA